MTITRQKQVEEIIEVETPSAWFNEMYSRHYLIKDDGEVIMFSQTQITRWNEERSKKYYNECVGEAVKSEQVDYDQTAARLEQTLESFREKIIA